MSMLRGVIPHTIAVVTSCKYVDITGPRCGGTVLVIAATVTATVHCSAWKALAMTQVARARISNVISIHNTFLCQQSVFWKYPLLMNFISRQFKHRPDWAFWFLRNSSDITDCKAWPVHLSEGMTPLINSVVSASGHGQPHSMSRDWTGWCNCLRQSSVDIFYLGGHLR